VTNPLIVERDGLSLSKIDAPRTLASLKRALAPVLDMGHRAEQWFRQARNLVDAARDTETPQRIKQAAETIRAVDAAGREVGRLLKYAARAPGPVELTPWVARLDEECLNILVRSLQEVGGTVEMEIKSFLSESDLPAFAWRCCQGELERLARACDEFVSRHDEVRQRLGLR
jgi:hypothetical protein